MSSAIHWQLWSKSCGDMKSRSRKKDTAMKQCGPVKSKATTMPAPHSAWMQVRSIKELMANEKRILERIVQTPNGGNLFMAHPLLFFKDVGVSLNHQTKKDLLRLEPSLSGLSPTPYLALKENATVQSVRYNIRGLFNWRKLK
jgi:hypothetical protein